ncbi:hypothetical protein HH303_12315 [Rhodospirillaceae bacterium KN72]|uniref:Uncharacterized protein n=1 Tax=Pacificispira spongiicola TaxID=2729598 RepID=A0A7Y0E110_9PROT|nr:hypothetical protein [Pacificispira spongiicola]NMM45268.1 hypothetical protein [Pacificispira spongiicola]
MTTTRPSDAAECRLPTAATAIFLFLIGAFAAALPKPGAAQDTAQDTGEFSQNFYNATKCMKVEEVNNNGLRTITAQNLCNAQVAALVCYRIIQANNVYSDIGWYCDFSNFYDPGTIRTVSRSGYYHPKRKVAACAAANTRCVQVLRSTDVRVRDNRQEPEKVSRAVRTQVGG